MVVVVLYRMQNILRGTSFLFLFVDTRYSCNKFLARVDFCKVQVHLCYYIIWEYYVLQYFKYQDDLTVPVGVELIVTRS